MTEPLMPIWKQEVVLLTDASWQVSRKASIAAMLFCAERDLIWTMVKPMMAEDPFQAEAMAVDEAIEEIKGYKAQWGLQQINVFSDCRSLIEALKKGDITNLPSWRAAHQIVRTRANIRTIKAKIRLNHAGREALHQPHHLANWARKTEGQFQGQPTQTFLSEHKLDPRIDEKKYTWEDLEPD
jgi:Reverse transcriptase-like